MSDHPPAANDTAVRPRFRLHVVSAGLLIISIVGHVLHGLAAGVRESRPRPEAWGMGIGEAIASALIAYLAGQLAFYALRRSNRSANIVFCALLLLTNLATSTRH